MNLFALAIYALLVAGIVAAHFLGTFFVLYMGRKVRAKTQHREGEARELGLSFSRMELADLIKVSSKMRGFRTKLTLPERVAFQAWKLTPLLFLFILFGHFLPASILRGEYLFLLFLSLTASVLEIYLLNAAGSELEGLELRRWLMVKVLAALSLTTGALTLSLRYQTLDLRKLSLAQTDFPFLAMAVSPGLLLTAILSFVAVCFLTMSIGGSCFAAQSIKEERQFDFYLVRSAWIFSYGCMWIYIFAGGASGLMGLITFPFKLFCYLFVFMFLDSFLVKMRSMDAGRAIAKYLLPACLVGLILEILWLGVMA